MQEQKLIISKRNNDLGFRFFSANIFYSYFNWAEGWSDGHYSQKKLMILFSQRALLGLTAAQQPARIACSPDHFRSPPHPSHPRFSSRPSFPFVQRELSPRKTFDSITHIGSFGIPESVRNTEKKEKEVIPEKRGTITFPNPSTFRFIVFRLRPILEPVALYVWWSCKQYQHILICTAMNISLVIYALMEMTSSQLMADCH